MVRYKNPPNQSKGILDDFAVRKNLATREGTIEHIPTDPKHIVNKEYVDNNAGLWTNGTNGAELKTDDNIVAGYSKKFIIERQNAGPTGQIYLDGTETDLKIDAASAVGTIGLRINAVDKLYVNSIGDVGIGTTNPIANLHVKDVSGTSIHLQTTGGGTTAQMGFQNDSEIWLFGVYGGDSDKFKILLGASTKFKIDTTGNAAMDGTFTSAANITGATLTAGDGATGSFTAASGETVTVVDGIITFITSTTFIVLLETGDAILMENADRMENG